MSDEQKLSEQDETKKPYVTPELTVYGTVEELTRGGTAIRPNDANSTPFQGLGPQKKAPATPTRKP